MGSPGPRTPQSQPGPAGVRAASSLTNLSVFPASIPTPATGLNALPQSATVSGHGSGNLPASPSSPVPATPATPGGLPDSGGINVGTGFGSGSGATGGVAILVSACLLMLCITRRRSSADVPSTSAILCLDERPG
jgi:hypothetical protein